MPSPFPGVDPFVEDQRYWPDFHHKFLNYWAEAIGDALPDDYEARLDERVNLIDLEVDEARSIRPDIAVVYRTPHDRGVGRGGTLELEPETIATMILDEERQAFINILHRPDRDLVTVLELLSPANKVQPYRRDYLTRRNAILSRNVHLVELDLLVAGTRVPMKSALPPGDFHAVIGRSQRRPDCEVYSWSIRQPLPLLPIPLRSPDPDVRVDLATVYRTAFNRGRYERSIDYEAVLDLPLAPEDRAWAEGIASTIGER